MSARWRHEHRRALRVLIGGGLAAALVTGLATAATARSVQAGLGDLKVGSISANGDLLPTNQWVKPLGRRLLVGNGRLLSSAISPNGAFLAALTWDDFTGFLTIINLGTDKVVEQLGLPGKERLGDGTVAADGPLWSPDGSTLWFPQTYDIVRLNVAASGKVTHSVVIRMTEVTTSSSGVKKVHADLPSGMALSPDGSMLYVALNGLNELGVIDTATNTLVQTIKTGNAPRQVVLAGDDAFVSDEGGERATTGQFTNSSDGTQIVANPVTGAASTGTVTEIDLTTGEPVAQISVGLEPTAEYLAPDGTLMVANSNDDSLSFIDTATGTVEQTVNVNPLPGSTVGSYPNGITMPDPGTILVSIGRDNALAVYGYNGPTQPVSYEGLLPTDWYPVDVAYDPATGDVVVTNDKGDGSANASNTNPKQRKTRPGHTTTLGKGPRTKAATGYNTYDDLGSVTQFSMPSMSAIGGYTDQVFLDNGWDHMLASNPLTGCKARAVPIPTRLGCPSTIKHVFLIIRENRTYDQVFGDVRKGNGDPADAQFGASVTPNAHALADDFGLFDNFYDEGTLSADGHNWLVQADVNDYIEKEFGAFYRSYPASGADALAYQRDGFLWNAAQAAHRSVVVYGEYNNYMAQPTLPATKTTPTWSDYYRDAQIIQHQAKGTLPVPTAGVYSYSDIPSLNQVDYHSYPAFGLNIPDQYRADIWLHSFSQYERNGRLPNLELIWLPDDHTAGVGSGDPDPVAEVADNDLAVGRIVQAISRSRYWRSSAIFVVEDDTQDGVDHVDGHRGPLLVISPWARRGVVDKTYYTQLNVVRTIEQILGIAPMNQEDRAAWPMFDAFTGKSNDKPYSAVKEKVPLTLGLKLKKTKAGDEWVPATPAQQGIPRSEWAVYEEWVAWSQGGRFNGAGAIQDYANPAQLNRLDWYSAHDWKVPYPGDTTILAPDQVPGRNLPADYLGD